MVRIGLTAGENVSLLASTKRSRMWCVPQWGPRWLPSSHPREFLSFDHAIVSRTAIPADGTCLSHLDLTIDSASSSVLSCLFFLGHNITSRYSILADSSNTGFTATTPRRFFHAVPRCLLLLPRSVSKPGELRQRPTRVSTVKGASATSRNSIAERHRR